MDLKIDWKVGLAAAALIVAVVFALQTRWSDERAAWELQADQVRERSAELVEEAAEAAAAAARRAIEAEAKADSAEAAREAAEAILTTLPPVPAECEAVVAQRDTIFMEVIDTLVVSSDMYRQAWTIERARADDLALLNGGLATQLAETVKLLDKRPKDRWWMPEVGAGVFAGICTTGQPCTGVGATLAWKVRLP